MFVKRKRRVAIIIAICIVILLVMLSVFSLVVLNIKHSEEIHAKITSIGGELIDYESVNVQNSPFDSDSNGRNKIYKITYMKEGKEYIAWYRAIKNPIDIHSPSSKSLAEKWIYTQ
ncbi:hypothetical protein [Brevibacillus gelatini]